MLHLLFFLSGFSGLIYQVVWVREFGNVFGNTIQSASLVVAVFMLGLGVGSYVVGAWSDKRYAVQPDSLLRWYGYVELVIAALGFVISMLLPHLAALSALVTSYTRDAVGWYVLTMASYLARVAIALFLLTPITLLMGGTLTLLIRHLVRRDPEVNSRRIAVLYAVNTGGAALGCFLTDFALVPAAGLLQTQLVAVAFNVVAGVGALYLARRPVFGGPHEVGSKEYRGKRSGRRPGSADSSGFADPASHDQTWRPVILTSLALALSGFAAMGMEILWFRHFTILLGGFRAVFSLLLTVILIGIGVGAFASGILQRRTRRPAEWLMAVQALFAVSTLIGLAVTNANAIERMVLTDPAYRIAAGLAEGALVLDSGLGQTLREIWFNAKPILWEVAIPALLMGFSFPLANAIIQHAERSVGRRAGVLYLFNTFGAVCGSLAVGFLLLPTLSIQGSASVLIVAAVLAIVPLYLSTVGADAPARTHVGEARKLRPYAAAASLVMALAALTWWVFLPDDYVIQRALATATENDRQLTLSEGVTEVITVTEVPGKGRTLVTNGHPMSSTRKLSQRYMRALAHIPLLSIDHPENVLVIGFGVGNTTHAATLHPSVRRVEVADLSRHILAHAGYFRDVNGDVLSDPRVAVYVNDGRQHLQMQPPDSYDLITLEPPPIGYAGVAALYSKEFYGLARSRLKAGGYLSQWLPANQVPSNTTLAMVRAFIDVFPQAVLLSGAEADLLLIGTTAPGIEIDPDRLDAALSNAPAVQADLDRLDLGTVREIVGTFVGSSRKLAEGTRDTPAVTDDRPIQEYGVVSLLDPAEAVPASIIEISQVAAWCPKCFIEGAPSETVEGLDTYLALINLAYTASPTEVRRARALAEERGRLIAGSAYLGAIVPETPDVHNILGITLASEGRLDEAVVEFRQALALGPDLAETHWHLGAALASLGVQEEAIVHLRRSVELDPGNQRARQDLEFVLQRARRPS